MFSKHFVLQETETIKIVILFLRQMSTDAD